MKSKTIYGLVVLTIIIVLVVVALTVGVVTITLNLNMPIIGNTPAIIKHNGTISDYIKAKNDISSLIPAEMNGLFINYSVTYTPFARTSNSGSISGSPSVPAPTHKMLGGLAPHNA